MSKELKSEDLELASEETTMSVEAKVMHTEKKDTMRKKEHEIPQLRGANKKVFRMSDGTDQAEFYPNAVFMFDDETNEYTEPDNTLVLDADGTHYRNKKGSFTAKFNCEEEKNELFSIQKDGHKVVVSSKQSPKVLGKKIKVAKALTNPNAKESDLLCNIVSFSGVDASSSLEYAVTNNGIKENIIISEKSPTYHYAFILTCENVSVVFDDISKRVAFISNETGEEVFFIPAPFMTDANEEISNAVSYEVKKLKDDVFQLTVSADSEWINAEERAFPVAIDPQIMVSVNDTMGTLSWACGMLYHGTSHMVGTVGNCDEACNAFRMYMSIDLPELPNNPRIKKAELVLTQKSFNSNSDEHPKFGLFKVDQDIYVGAYPTHDTTLIDYNTFKYVSDDEDGEIRYTFDITSLIDDKLKTGAAKANLALMLLDESSPDDQNITIYGAFDNATAPKVLISYESSYAVNNSYRTHSHELGKYGTGMIDLATGNLMIEHTDVAWNGNLMPVTIKHFFNSALAGVQYTNNPEAKLNVADFSNMKVGLGWRLNIMQSMVPQSFYHDGETIEGYVYTDESGAESYFKLSKDNIFTDIETETLEYDSTNKVLTIGDDKYTFDAIGRLISISDKYENTMSITYTAGLITSVTDGAGRDFVFDYSNNYLRTITAPDGTIYECIYSGDHLTSLQLNYMYNEFHYDENSQISKVVLTDVGSLYVKEVRYEYANNRLSSASEYSWRRVPLPLISKSTYDYNIASRRTIVSTTIPADEDTEEQTINTVYVFDDDGNVISEYMYTEETGNVSIEGGASNINPYFGGSMNVVSNSDNLLRVHNFADIISWYKINDDPDNHDTIRISGYPEYSKFNNNVMMMLTHGNHNGVYQTTSMLSPGEYTASAYVYMIPAFDADKYANAYIRITDLDGNIIGESERITKVNREFVRLITSFTIDEPKQVKVYLIADGSGLTYYSNAQLEKNAFASPYNFIENGNFEIASTYAWTMVNAEVSSAECFNNSKSLAVVSDLDSEAYACQTINVKKEDSTRQTFTLSGWAKGEGIIDREREACKKPSFCLRACINYKSGECEEHIAEFSPCTEGWQFASVEFAKEKFCAVESIKVYCDYSNNVGTAYFDNIQLVCNSIETELSADDFATISEDYSADEDTAEDTFDPGFSTEAEETDSAPEFEEARDPHGNPFTETNFVDGEFGTIYRSFKYFNDMDHIGNDLTCETDPRGNETNYDVNTNTSKNNAVIDRCGNKTEYEYDRFGEVSKVTSFEKIGVDDEGNPIHHPLADVSYAYCEFGQLGMITRGDGMKYNIGYDEFNQLQSIGINGKPEKLVKYDYKPGSGRLKSVTYANGNVMYATYNSIGQMVSETWKDAEDGNIIAYYKYVYDGSGNIVRTLDITSDIEYTYTYEEGRIVRATETVVIYDINCIAVSRGDTNNIFYSYNNEGQLVKKRVVTSDGAERITYYEHNDDNTIVKFSADGLNATAHSKTDGFGRKIFDEVQTGKGFVSRQFSYHAGAVTESHKASDKVKSSPTTQLVSRIELSDGRSLSYEYDAEERINSVVESYVVDGQPVTNTTLYTYDALGQLLTETVNGVVVNEMTYDNYGNILTKNGKVYTYGDSVWKDKLTAIDGQAITYDAQGNPVSYLGHDLTWEKGRQLKYFDGVSYTYNANGIRTSKTVNGAKHTFILEGTKIIREYWAECSAPHAIIPIYDNEDSVCGIDYGNHTFYFLKNLQGDIIAITDVEGNVVGRYSYDAWGVPTITQDSSFTVWEKGVELYSFNIAEVNPFRYRGYYYDNEIGLYYLQSRYYDPVIGRFVNGDHIDIVNSFELVNHYNIFSYCINDPINETDESGSLIASKVAQVILGAVCGLLIQLVSDLLGYLADRVFAGKKYTFSPEMWPYISSAINYALESLNPFTKKAKAFVAILKLVPTVVKHVWRWMSGEEFSLSDLIWDVTYVVVSAIVSSSLNYSKKQQLKNLKNYYKKRTPEYKLKHLQLNAHFKALGKKFEVSIDIAGWIIDRVLKAIGVF